MSKIYRDKFVIIPKYRFIPLIWALVFNLTVYISPKIIAGGWHHYNIESRIDRYIPFWPPAVVIYLGCYLFWGINYIMIAHLKKEEMCRFFSADFISRVICLFFYLVFPTTYLRPVPEPEGFWNKIMIFVYAVDTPDNLFPSIHCLISWFCYIGLRGKKQISAGYRRFSLVMAIMVCVSTVLTKQHVIADVISGVLLAEFSYWLGGKPVIWKKYEKILDMLNRFVFHGKEKYIRT